MKEVTVTPICDRHLEDGERVLATVTRTLSIDGEPREVDLCEVCDKWLDDVRALIERGVAPETKATPSTAKKGKRTKGKYGCEFVLPGGGVCDFRTNSESGLGRHRTVQKHPKSDTLSSLGATG